MSEAKATRDQISIYRQNLENIFNSILPRLEQVSTGQDLTESRRIWRETNAKLAHEIGIGLRPEALLPLLQELFDFSSKIIAGAMEGTALDLSSEQMAFKKLSDEWQLILIEHDLSTTPPPASKPSALLAVSKELQVLAAKIEKNSLSLSGVHDKIAALEAQFNYEVEPIKAKYETAIDAFNRVEPELNDRAKKLDELVRLQGQKVLAGRYEVDADNEEKAADRFRYATLAVMSAVIALIAFSYYEVAEFTLNPTQAGIRIVFSLILSLPAAYLARESAKHRQRQYVLRQTALEIGAIDSYIQTLPIESQNKIKEETAIKLFTPQKLDSFDKESYPINAQELFSKLIDVVGELKKEVKSKKESKKDED